MGMAAHESSQLAIGLVLEMGTVQYSELPAVSLNDAPCAPTLAQTKGSILT